MWQERIGYKILGALVIVGIVLFFVRDMAKPGLPMLHDSNPHISRMIAFHTALEDGQFPPMWAKEVLGGIGSPVMMLNYQLPYFVSEGFVRSGLTYFDSYKLTLVISLVASAVVMYLALLSKFGLVPGFVGAAIYTLAPYRFLDIFVRGALGESLTFIFPPLLLLGFFRSSMPILVIGWTGMFLTHPTASAAFSAFYLGYILFVGEKKYLAERLKIFFGSFLMAVMMAGFNLLPTIALTKFTYYSPELSDTLLMFPSFWQLIYSKWGYGVSLPGTNDGMSFAIGAIQWISLAGLSIYALKKRNIEARYLIIVSILCLAMILPISMPIYQVFHLSNFIDFPWRLIFCLVFASGWAGALLLNKIKDQKIQYAVAILVVIALAIQSMPIAHTDKYWQRSLAWFARETGDSYGEYAPLTRATRDSAPFWKRAEFVSGDGEIKTILEKSNHQIYEIQTDNDSEVRINTAYFPGWQIPSNCYITKRRLSHIDDSGLIGCKVGPGKSQIEIRFVAPTVQKIGNMLTLLAVGGYIWILYRSFYPHSTKQRR